MLHVIHIALPVTIHRVKQTQLSTTSGHIASKGNNKLKQTFTVKYSDSQNTLGHVNLQFCFPQTKIFVSVYLGWTYWGVHTPLVLAKRHVGGVPISLYQMQMLDFSGYLSNKNTVLCHLGLL